MNIYIFTTHQSRYFFFLNTSVMYIYIYIRVCYTVGIYAFMNACIYVIIDRNIFPTHAYATSVRKILFFSLSLKKRVCGMWYNSRSISNLCWSVPVTSRLQRSIGMRRAAHSLLPFGSHDPNLRKDVDRCCIKSVASVSNTYAARRKSTCACTVCVYIHIHTRIYTYLMQTVFQLVYIERNCLTKERKREMDRYIDREREIWYIFRVFLRENKIETKT